MNDAQILTHAAFDRPPVLNARRRGPTPRGIPMLSRERWERRSERGVLRKWAKEHGIEAVNGASFYGAYDYDKIRELKARQEAQNELTPEEQIAVYEAALDEAARGLLVAARAINAVKEKLRSS